jgi:hypothetical protein
MPANVETGELVSAVRRWGRVINLYRNGVESDGRFTSFRDLETVRVRITTFRGIRVYDFELSGRNAEGPFSTRFDWKAAARHSPEADYIIKAAAAPIVDRMRAELETRESVRWTKTAVLTADGLMSVDEGRQVAYADISSATIQQGISTGTLIVTGRDRFEALISTTVDNFFPGYFLLIERLSPDAAPKTMEADRFSNPVRAPCFVLAAGFFVMALGMFLVTFFFGVARDPVEVYVFAGIVAGLALICLCRGLLAKD